MQNGGNKPLDSESVRVVRAVLGGAGAAIANLGSTPGPVTPRIFLPAAGGQGRVCVHGSGMAEGPHGRVNVASALRCRVGPHTSTNLTVPCPQPPEGASEQKTGNELCPRVCFLPPQPPSRGLCCPHSRLGWGHVGDLRQTQNPLGLPGGTWRTLGRLRPL